MTREKAIDFLECRRGYYASLSTDPSPLIKATKVCGYTLAESANACLMAIKALEQEFKTGHWIRWYEHKKYDWGIDHIPHCKCSECGKEYDPHSSQFIKFCSECGARMFEPQERKR